MVLNRVAVGGLVLAVAACTTVRHVPPAEFIPQHAPALVWVTTTSAALVPVAQPYIDGDTLRGKWAGTQKPIAIHLQGIESVQAKTPARSRSILMFATLGVGLGAMIWSIEHSGNAPQGPCANSSDPEECE
jgi:hypothetical protein